MNGHAVTVAYDGSADAARALQWGVDLARKGQAPLTVRIHTEPGFEDPLAGQWAAEAEALLSFCGLDQWTVDLDDSPTADGAVLVLPPTAAATGPAHAGPFSPLGRTSSGTPTSGVAPYPVVTVRRALDRASTRVVVGVRDPAGSRGAVEFGYDHADWIGGSVQLVDLTGRVRRELVSLVDELALTYPHLPVTLAPADSVSTLIDLSRRATLVVVAADSSPGTAELTRDRADCPVAVVG
jgi:nucleotide-binding universal stress UspA family protein